MRALRTCALLALAMTFCFASSASAQQYSITNLGDLTGFTYPQPNAINKAGQVVGSTYTSDFATYHAFRTEPNSPINPATDDLGGLSGYDSSGADGINTSGQVVGTSHFPDYSVRSFRIDPSAPTTLIDLGIRSGVLSTTIHSADAFAINDAGQVTGGADAPEASIACSGTATRAFRTAPDGDVTTADDLGTLAPNNCRESFGFAINTSGQVVGWSYASLSGYDRHCFLANPNTAMQDLGSLGGSTCTADAINDAGQIAGYSALANGDTHAFLLNPNSTMQDLGTLGGASSYALGINSAGLVVGYSAIADNSSHAFIYQNGTMVDLNTLIPANTGWVLESADAINDLGQIVGTGKLNGNPAAFRLDPPTGAAGVSILISELSNSSLPLTPTEIDELTAKLNAALASLQADKTAATDGQLDAFINSINALVDSSRLSPTDAASLISEAENIISNLN